MRLPRAIPFSGSSPRSVQAFAEQSARTLSRGVSFGSELANSDQSNNMDCWKATGTSPGVANTEFVVHHNLNRVPIGFIVVQLDQPAVFYGTPSLGTAWTKATGAAQGSIYLKCNTVTVVFAVIII